jgi:hypothetical protein
MNALIASMSDGLTRLNTATTKANKAAVPGLADELNA